MGPCARWRRGSRARWCLRNADAGSRAPGLGCRSLPGPHAGGIHSLRLLREEKRRAPRFRRSQGAAGTEPGEAQLLALFLGPGVGGDPGSCSEAPGRGLPSTCNLTTHARCSGWCVPARPRGGKGWGWQRARRRARAASVEPWLPAVKQTLDCKSRGKNEVSLSWLWGFILFLDLLGIVIGSFPPCKTPIFAPSRCPHSQQAAEGSDAPKEGKTQSLREASWYLNPARRKKGFGEEAWI